MSDNYLNVWSPKPQPFCDKQEETIAKQRIDILNTVKFINVLYYPLMKIVSHPINIKLLSLKTLTSKESLYLFVSQNAVRTAVPQINKIDKNFFLNKKVLAIGPTTYQSLLDHEINPCIKVEGQFTSESLLASEDFSNVLSKTKYVFLFSGEGGRKYLLDTLMKKKLEVIKVESYRRIKINTNQLDMLKFLQLKKIDAIFLTSCELIDLIVEQLRQSQVLANFLNKVVFCISPRVAKYATNKGFLNIVIAKRSDNQSLINAAIVWFENNE